MERPELRISGGGIGRVFARVASPSTTSGSFLTTSIAGHRQGESRPACDNRTGSLNMGSLLQGLDSSAREQEAAFARQCSNQRMEESSDISRESDDNACISTGSPDLQASSHNSLYDMDSATSRGSDDGDSEASDERDSDSGSWISSPANLESLPRDVDTTINPRQACHRSSGATQEAEETDSFCISPKRRTSSKKEGQTITKKVTADSKGKGRGGRGTGLRSHVPLGISRTITEENEEDLIESDSNRGESECGNNDDNESLTDFLASDEPPRSHTARNLSVSESPVVGSSWNCVAPVQSQSAAHTTPHPPRKPPTVSIPQQQQQQQQQQHRGGKLQSPSRIGGSGVVLSTSPTATGGGAAAVHVVTVPSRSQATSCLPCDIHRSSRANDSASELSHDSSSPPLSPSATLGGVSSYFCGLPGGRILGRSSQRQLCACCGRRVSGGAPQRCPKCQQAAYCSERCRLKHAATHASACVVRAGQRHHGRILASLDMEDDDDDDDSMSDTGQCTCMGTHEGQPHLPSPTAAAAASGTAASTGSATTAVNSSSSASTAPHKRATWSAPMDLPLPSSRDSRLQSAAPGSGGYVAAATAAATAVETSAAAPGSSHRTSAPPAPSLSLRDGASRGSGSGANMHASDIVASSIVSIVEAR